MIVRKATAEDGPRIDELFAIAFEEPLKRSKEPRQEDPKVHSWAAFSDEGDMMSAFCVSDFTIQFDGHHCKMGGVGGVSTLPQYRRRGGIRGCFEKALPDMYQTGYDFSYLYPFSTEYYRKFGYECCVQKLLVTVDLGLLKVPQLDGYFRLAEKNNPMREEIRYLDYQWECRYNMMVIHGDEAYNFTEKFDPAVDQEFTYVYYDAQGTPKAYTTFVKTDHRDGRNLVCTWLFFADAEGFQGLMSLFKSLAADHRYVKFILPADTAMQYLMPEWSLGSAQFALQAAGMVRVINVKSVLEKAKYQGTGSVVLEIRDNQIPENNGRLAVSFQDGEAAAVTVTQDEPDAVLDVPAFSALIAGVSAFEDARRWMPGVQVKNGQAPLDRVFYRKNLMLVDYF